MKFSDTLWQQVNPIYQSIIYHPFNVELAQGSLNREQFIFYLEQDAHYLVNFSRALAFIAARSNTSNNIRQFLDFALGALVAERELHAKFLPSGKNWDCISPSPACMGYSQYLIATTATGSIEEAVAAVLPCFWIYREVGKSISLLAAENNPYQLWIDTYASEEFSEAVDQAISILDVIADECSPHSLMRMQNAFESSSLFEWHFWDDAYHKIVFKEAYFNQDVSEKIFSAGFN